jgi:DNA repair exonuclease SbcCD ATPase subunit
MKLKALHIKNFKGLGTFDLTPNESGVTTIYGANASGKTTIMDAFTWLLFDKDSLNSSVFEIKPLDASGEAAHGQEHGVAAILDVDGKTHSLKKVYKEKWVKPRGAAHKQFTGHTTKYWIDEVPAKKKEFTAKVKELCDEDTFKILTNPRYFNEVLHWQDRRNLLLEVCGDIHDADVLAADKDLLALTGILEKRSLEDHRKIIASRRAEINREIDQIPVRIDEAEGQRVAVDRGMRETVDSIKSAEKQREKAQDKVNAIKAGAVDAVLTHNLRNVEAAIQRIDMAQTDRKHDIANERSTRKSVLLNKVWESDFELEGLMQKMRGLDADRDALAGRIETLNSEMDAQREAWFVENKRQFEHSQDSICPTCGQDLPEDQIAAARFAAEEAFNIEKARNLSMIQTAGQEKKAAVAEATRELEAIDAQLLGLSEKLAAAREADEKAKQALEEFKNEPTEIVTPEDPERARLVEEQKSLEAQIASKTKDTASILTEAQSHVEIAQATIDALEKDRLQLQANGRIDDRVQELKKQERDLAAEFERLEQELFLSEQFIRTKVRLLESRINEKFKVARFRLFETQINEGLRECCEVLSNGVPYSSMNNAARVQIGVDICNTLSAHFDKRIPVFIDNAESVTDIPATEAQQFRLVVSDKDEKLRVE